MNESQYNWPLINNNISENDKKVLSDYIIHTDRFTNGPKVSEFERAWSKWLNAKYSIMVNSGSSANYISLSIVRELKGSGGEIIVPPIGWVSDISSVINNGFIPVFVDVNKNNMAISYENIKSAINNRTKAIILVHALGFNGIDEDIIQLAKENNLILIEDCCEAHGATFGNKKVGTIGDLSCFSFYFGHHITTIEGGMVCTNNSMIDQQCKMFRSHGMIRECSQQEIDKYTRSHPDLNPLFTFAVPGYNFRSTEINAVLGLEQINKLDEIIAKRSENLKIWLTHLDSKKYFTDFISKGNSSFALPLILNERDRSLFLAINETLVKNKIEFRNGTAGGGNLARQPFLKKHDYRIESDLEIANQIHEFGLYIGNHPEVSEKQIKHLCFQLNEL